MKQRVWRGMSYEEHTMLVQEVAKVLGREYCEFEVELFGVSQNARHLPDNYYEIVDYGSRDLLAIRIDGRTITDPDEMEAAIKQYEETEM